jgi:hypothetical protein
MTVRLLPICLAASLLAACASQEAARDLAANAAVNTAQLSATISRVAANERTVAEARAKTLADYDRAVRESKAALAYDIAITKKSGDQKAADLLKSLQDWIAEAERAAAVEGGTASERAQALLAQQTKIDEKAEALTAIAKILNELAKEQGALASAAFLRGYVGEVLTLLEASEKEAKAAEEKTNAAAAKTVKEATGTLPKGSSALTLP